MADKPANRPRQRPPSTSGVPVTKYYRSGQANSSKSPVVRSSPRKAPAWAATTADALIIAILLFGLVYSLMVKPQPKLKLSSTAYHPTSTYRQAAEEELKSFKNKNKITLDEQGIIKALQAKYPEISAGLISLPVLGQTPSLQLQISAPALNLVSGSGSYVIDSSGRLVAVSADLGQIKNLPVVIDQSGFSLSPGKQVLSTQSVDFITALSLQLKRASVPVKSLNLPASVGEVDLYTTDQAYFTKFLLSGDIDLQTGQYLAARHNFDASGQLPEQYLDVRVAGKIFYK